MNKDYFEARFKTAAHKLKWALALCGRYRCHRKVRAQLERDLGVVYIVGLHNTAKGVAAFKKALHADRKIRLDPAYVTPAVRDAFDRARGRSPNRNRKLHLRGVTEQAVRHPVPVFVESGKGLDAAEVRLYFKRSDEDHYRSVTMMQVGDGYGALIPCDTVHDLGTVDYFVRAFDKDDDPIGHAGSDNDPRKVEIVAALDEEAPHWPGRAPPQRCEAESESESGAAPGCESNSDCGSDQTCNDAGHCVAKAKPSAKSAPGSSKFLVSLAVEQDTAIVGGSNVCTEQSQLNDGYACFRANGSQYHGSPVLNRADGIGSGFTLATTRVLVGIDYLLFDHLTLGVRLGYVLRGGGPRPDGGKSFLPVDAEARAAYYLSHGGFNASGFNPYFFLSGGAAQVDATNRVFVFEDTSKPPPPYQIDNPPTQYLDAWRKMGTSFIAPGVGVHLALGKTTGLLAELRYKTFFPTSGSALSLSLGFAFGL